MLIIDEVYAWGCRYAWECQTSEGGWGLDGSLREHSWKLRGIVNGIDYGEWSPWADVFLRSDGYVNYTKESVREGKAACKAALQRVCLPLALSVLHSSMPPSVFPLIRAGASHCAGGLCGRTYL